MESKFIMGASDGLERSMHHAPHPTFISPRLRTSLIELAIQKACTFYQDFFEKPRQQFDASSMASEYEKDLAEGISLGLFKQGGIRRKDHLNLWCLGRVLAPECYIESGVFIGSSLHAFKSAPGLRHISAIDPDLSKLRIRKEDLPGAQLIDESDFSQLNFDGLPARTLAYFDDHVNAADRILQAHRQGVHYVLFDDATGFEGVCQRLYPAIPSIPMIMYCDSWEVGDKLSWTYQKSNTRSWVQKMKRILNRTQKEYQQVTLTITEELLESCRKAKERIKKWERLPDLGEFIPQGMPKNEMDTTKYLLELKL